MNLCLLQITNIELLKWFKKKYHQFLFYLFFFFIIMQQNTNSRKIRPVVGHSP